jgi:tRNA pseudouridine38-40 synthase
MPTIRIIVRYDGTGLSGWQRQPRVRTVQAELERAISEMAGESVIVRGSGRTDAGVHALGQVAAFTTRARIPPKGWQLGLSSHLPPQIAIREAREVPEGYSPRHISAGKRYRYLVLAARVRDPMLRERAWFVHDTLDRDAMAHAATALIGWHDFKAFRASDCQMKNTLRCVFRAALVPRWHGDPDVLAIEIEGTAFLKNMVRIITGTLVDVGRGRLDAAEIPALLAGGDRTRGGMTAPPHGLYLDEVFVRPECQLPGDLLVQRPAYAEPIVLSRDIARTVAWPAASPSTEASEDEEEPEG